MLNVWFGLALAAAPPSLDAEIRDLQAAAVPDRTAYALIESLTTEVGPRLAGSEAEARGRAWAVAKLKSLGFQNVRIETTPLEGWARGREKARILSPFPQRLAVTALGHSQPTPPEGIEAEVIRFETLTALKEAPKDSLRGKIAFIDLAMPKTQDGSSYGAVVAIRSLGPSTAARKGAAALLIRSVGTDQHRFPHTGMLRYADDAPRIPSAAISAPDADQLGRIYAMGKTIRIRLDLQTRPLGARETGNVIGEIRGTTHPEEIILVGAHLDSWDLGTGAVDDGAGCGIVMAAAKLILSSAPRRPARTLRVVLFGAEEVGLIGAKAYAKAHAAELPLHRLAMESDFGAQPVYRISGRVGDGGWPGVEAFRQSHLARLRIIPGENGRAGGPDLYPLRGEVPILGLDQDGRDYFDLHHTADDTLDKIDAASLSQNVAAYASVMWWASETGVDLRTELEADEARARPTPVR
ncbi:MAG: M28 family peptidase [Myxococcota bacterium]